jgi:hypothetical protein
MTEQEMIARVVKCPSPYDAPLKWIPTQFEQLLQKLGLTETTCLDSAAVAAWCRQHKNRRFIPEAILRHFKLQVSHDNFGEESPLFQNS